MKVVRNVTSSRAEDHVIATAVVNTYLAVSCPGRRRLITAIIAMLVCAIVDYFALATHGRTVPPSSYSAHDVH